MILEAVLRQFTVHILSHNQSQPCTFSRRRTARVSCCTTHRHHVSLSVNAMTDSFEWYKFMYGRMTVYRLHMASHMGRE